jgi:hypothetical protein
MVKEVLKWIQEQSHRKKGEEFIGVTTTMLALLTAGATLAGHRAHTEEVKFQTLATDQWGFYQAKHIRAHMYAIEAEKACLGDGQAARGKKKPVPGNKNLPDEKKKVAIRYLDKAIYEQCGDPIAPSCNFQVCREQTVRLGLSDQQDCSVPVLKDSPELRKLVQDDYFQKKYPAAPTTEPGKEDPRDDATAESVGASTASAHQAANSAKKPKVGALAILKEARTKDQEVDRTTAEAKFEDIAEIILEFSIMICSTAFVVGKESYRKTAYLFTAIGVAVGNTGVAVALFALPYARHPIVRTLTIAAAVVVFLSLVVWVLVYARYNDHAKHPAAQGARPEN